ncbi:MAG TPA: PKD domain-containing protein, partial [Saprospiraceae bacterium]|nr:PKD domain-containing protein [Saprospiraceae bacterium]
EGCAPLTVQFTDQSAGDPTSWHWTFEGGSPSISNDQNPSVTFPAPGTFTVTLTASNAFGSNSASNEIVVNGLPVAGFVYQTVSGTVIFGNQSNNALSYSWNFGDGSFSNEQSPTHTYTASGSYTVELTAINACGASTLQQTIQVIVSGLNDPSWLESFRLFPNPNDGYFSIDMSGQPQDEVAFTLFNAIGELVMRDKANFSTGHLLYRFEQGNLPAGVYSLGVQHGDRTFFVKVIVQQ